MRKKHCHYLLYESFIIIEYVVLFLFNAFNYNTTKIQCYCFLLLWMKTSTIYHPSVITKIIPFYILSRRSNHRYQAIYWAEVFNLWWYGRKCSHSRLWNSQWWYSIPARGCTSQRRNTKQTFDGDFWKEKWREYVTITILLISRQSGKSHNNFSTKYHKQIQN